MLDVSVETDGDWDSSTDWAALADRAARAAIGESAFPQLSKAGRVVEIAMRLSSDEEVHALNRDWREKDRPTNVLSFPMAEAGDLDAAMTAGPELMLGDIILAHGVCAREAADKGLPLESHAAHLMVHGTLHLLGYDHMDEMAASDMEAREIRALSRMNISDPYGDRG